MSGHSGPLFWGCTVRIRIDHASEGEAIITSNECDEDGWWLIAVNNWPEDSRAPPARVRKVEYDGLEFSE